MDMIKRNIRVIVIVVCIDIFLSICALALNNASKKDEKASSTKTTQATETKEKDINPENPLKKSTETLDDQYYTFQTNVNDLKNKIITYINANPVYADTCIPLSRIYNDPTKSGSAYIDTDKNITVWYTNGSYVLNGVEINHNTLKNDDISYQFTNAYYDNCGENN